MTTSNLLVEEFMVKKVFRVTPEMKLREVAEFLLLKQISGAPVVDTMDRLISVIGEGDTLRLAASEGLETTVAHCLSKMIPLKKVIVQRRDNTFLDIYRLFLKHNIHRIPIVDATNKVEGIVTRSTIFRIFIEAHYGRKLPPAKAST